MQTKKYQLLFLTLFILALCWSAIKPHDYFTWFLEVAPAIIGLIILICTRKKFEFTKMLYFLILLHALVLLIGGHYTYAEVPLFNWLRDYFDLDRNYYDRIGHFMQGLVPAIIAREILLRHKVLTRGKWFNYIIICLCLSVSVFYEFIEWWVALGTGSSAEAFLGTQGDVWDTQWDMFLALIGAISGLLFLSKYHDRELLELKK